MVKIKYLINFGGNLIELFVAICFYSKIFNRTTTKTCFVFVCVLATIFQFFNTTFLLTKSYAIILASTLFFFVLSLLYDAKIHKKILSSVFLCVISCLSEMIVAMFVTIIFKVDLAHTQNDILLFASCTLISKFLYFTIIMLIRLKPSRLTENSFVQFYFKILPLPIATMLALLLIFEYEYTVTSIKIKLFTLIASLFLILSNILIFWVIEEQNKHIETREQLNFAKDHINNQIIHYKELYNYQNELRKFKHNIKNNLISLLGLLEKDNAPYQSIETVKEWLNLHEESGVGIINTGNPVIDAVIQNKVNYATSENIEINFSFKCNSKIEIDEIEIGVLIGNALDNAIEALKKFEKNNRVPIVFEMFIIDNQISIRIENIVVHNVNTQNLYTTKANKNSHGFGTQTIKGIADKNGGEAIFECKNNVFTVQIFMPNI